MYFYNNNYSKLLEDMTDGLQSYDDSVSFLANAESIRLLMRQIAVETDILPDLIEFNTEDEDGWYYLSLDYNDYDDDFSYSIVNAIDDDGNFFVLRGTLFVDESVPDEFYEEVGKYHSYIDCNIKTVRVAEYCDGDCDSCPHYKEDEDEYLDVTDNSVRKTWCDEDGFHSYSFYSSNKDAVKKMLNKIK